MQGHTGVNGQSAILGRCRNSLTCEKLDAQEQTCRRYKEETGNMHLGDSSCFKYIFSLAGTSKRIGRFKSFYRRGRARAIGKKQLAIGNWQNSKPFTAEVAEDAKVGQIAVGNWQIAIALP